MIFAKGIRKSTLYTFTGKDDEQGLVFLVDLEDDAGMTIRAKFFNAAAEKFYSEMEEGAMFGVGNFTVMDSNHQFDECTSPYELKMEKHSIVHVVE